MFTPPLVTDTAGKAQQVGGEEAAESERKWGKVDKKKQDGERKQKEV